MKLVHFSFKKKLHDLETSHSHATEKFEIKPSAKKKKIVTICYYCEGLLLCKFLPRKTRNSSNRYCETLEKFCKGIKGKRPG